MLGGSSLMNSFAKCFVVFHSSSSCNRIIYYPFTKPKPSQTASEQVKYVQYETDFGHFCSYSVDKKCIKEPEKTETQVENKVTVNENHDYACIISCSLSEACIYPYQNTSIIALVNVKMLDATKQVLIVMLTGQRLISQR